MQLNISGKNCKTCFSQLNFFLTSNFRRNTIDLVVKQVLLVVKQVLVIDITEILFPPRTRKVILCTLRQLIKVEVLFLCSLRCDEVSLYFVKQEGSR